MTRNYDRRLSASILCRGKCGNYRDTGVSKNIYPSIILQVGGYNRKEINSGYHKYNEKRL